MKKVEAQLLAPESSRFIVGYIEQLLENNRLFTDSPSPFNTYTLKFWHEKINGENMCILIVDIPKIGLKKIINTNITYDHIAVIYQQLLKDLLEFIESDKIGISKFYDTHAIRCGSFTGVTLYNLHGCNIGIDFTSCPDIVSEEYNKSYVEKVEALNVTNSNLSK